MGDNLKAPPSGEGDNGDNPNSFLEENKNNFLPTCDSQTIGTYKEEVENNNYLNNSQVVTSVTNPSPPGIEAVTEAVTPEINWATYPYQSKDSQTLKNRANKVKERVNSCTTNNQLISLYADGLVSEAEINWLKSNLLTGSERQQLKTAQATKQTNLFIPYDEKQSEKNFKPSFNEIKEQIDTEVKRIGWSKEIAISYIEDKYSVSSRLDMTIQQLIELRDYLSSQVTAGGGKKGDN